MSQAVRFELSGTGAFFKRPDVNAHTFFTFSHIHKLALYGIFGSMMGYSGHIDHYNRKNVYKEEGYDEVYPEFYRNLRDVKVAIVPLVERAYFEKKVHAFNNHIGYANKEDSGNLITREQWLHDPRWLIYVLVDGNSSELVDTLLSGDSVYVPYLGKNDHPATISDVRLVDLDVVEDVEYVNSLFELEKVDGFSNRGTVEFMGSSVPYYLSEHLPSAYQEPKNLYEYTEYVATNLKILDVLDLEVYHCGEYSITFI